MSLTDLDAPQGTEGIIFQLPSLCLASRRGSAELAVGGPPSSQVWEHSLWIIGWSTLNYWLPEDLTDIWWARKQEANTALFTQAPSPRFSPKGLIWVSWLSCSVTLIPSTGHTDVLSHNTIPAGLVCQGRLTSCKLFSNTVRPEFIHLHHETCRKLPSSTGLPAAVCEARSHSLPTSLTL